MSLSRAFGLALGYAADQAFGDPRSYHPVAGFGRLAAALEERTYTDGRTAGVGHVALLVGGTVTAGWAIESIIGKNEWVRVLTTAASTWAVLGGRSLVREADILAAQLSVDDLDAARRQIRNLVGRDPSELDADELARACVESVAENTSDAVVAPLFWGAVLGLPGLLGYRAINTLDAMIGHRSPRYERFGWAAARLDDVANWLPARLAGSLAAVSAPLVGGSPVAAVRAAAHDSGQHPSPNAGVVEAAFAGALGVRLGGVNVYQGEVEDRGQLGDGRQVAVGDIARTARLSRLVGFGSLVVAVALGARQLPRTPGPLPQPVLGSRRARSPKRSRASRTSVACQTTFRF